MIGDLRFVIGGPLLPTRKSPFTLHKFLLPVAVLLLGAAAHAQQSSPSADTTSRCKVATDPTYGLTAQNAIRIGGGPVTMAARERQYLGALRGPVGETIATTTVGSSIVNLPVGPTVIDVYPVTLADGRTLSIYIDAYHYAALQAPIGFTCATPIAVPPPGVDPLLASRSLAALAVAQGATRQFAPIYLNAPDAPRVAVMDQFRVVAHLAHAAAQAGAPLDPQRPPTAGSAILAYAQECNGQTVAAKEIEIRPPQGAALAHLGPYLDDTTAKTRLPGLALAPSTLVALFNLPLLRPADSVRVVYDGMPCGTTPSVDLPVVATPLRFTANQLAVLPAGHASVTEPVLLQALIDVDGRIRKASYVGGPEDLLPAAMTAVEQWRADPPKINGTPIVTPGMIAIQFR